MRQNAVILRRGLAVSAPENDEDLDDEEDLFRPPAKFFEAPNDSIVACSRIEGGRLYVRFYEDAAPSELDERVGSRVHDIYMRRQRENGHAPQVGRSAGLSPHLAAIQPGDGHAPSRPERPRAPVGAKTFAASRRVEQETTTMASEKDLTETQAQVLAAYQRAAKELGRPPSNVELAEDLVDTVMSKSVEGRVQLVSKARAVLVSMGLAEKAKKGPQGRRGAQASESAPRGLSMPAPKVKSKPATKTKAKKPAAAAAPVAAPAMNEDPVIRMLREEAEKAAERSERLNRAIAALAGE